MRQLCTGADRRVIPQPLYGLNSLLKDEPRAQLHIGTQSLGLSDISDLA